MASDNCSPDVGNLREVLQPLCFQHRQIVAMILAKKNQVFAKTMWRYLDEGQLTRCLRSEVIAMTFFHLFKRRMPRLCVLFSLLLTSCASAGARESAQKANALIERNLGWISRAKQLELSPTQVGRIWAELGVTYQDLMQYSQAEAAYLHALVVFEHEPAAAHDYAATLSNLGSLYYDTGRLDAAERMELRSLEVAERLGDRERLAHAEGQLSQLYLEEHKLRKAAEYSLKASEDFSRTPDSGGVNSAMALVIHAYATCEKRCDEGLRSAQQAMELLSSVAKPEESVALGQAYMALGFTEQQTGAPTKAGDDLREGVRILEQNIGPGDSRLTDALKLYRKYLAANHRYGEAAEIAERVRASETAQACASCTISVRGLQ
jgi:tetratricopeptide (TPR) repeat protein